MACLICSAASDCDCIPSCTLSKRGVSACTCSMICTSCTPTVSTSCTLRRTSSENFSTLITPGGDRRLHLLHHLLDVPGRDRGLVGETADLGGDHREALAVFTGLLGLDRGVERLEIGLIGHLGDGSHDGVDVAGLLVEHLELGGNGHRGLDLVVHGGFHLVETGLTVGGGRGGSLGDECDLLHGAHQLLRGGGDLRGGRDDLVDRGGLLGGGRFLLLGGGGDLGGGRRHRYAGLLHLIHERTQVLLHTLHALAEFADGVAAADVEVAREITFCGARHHAEDRIHLALQFLECLAAFLHEAAQVVHHLLQTRAEFADRIFPGETHLTREVAHCGLVDHTEQDVHFIAELFCGGALPLLQRALAIGGTVDVVRHGNEGARELTQLVGARDRRAGHGVAGGALVQYLLQVLQRTRDPATKQEIHQKQAHHE